MASLETSASFGLMMAAEAQERRFYAAPRRAFVADGQAYNWTIWRGYFGYFEPIEDFLHAVCYVFSAAAAVSADEGAGWSQYRVWMRACWQGRAGEVLVELDQWQARLCETPPSEAVTAEEQRDPRRVVAQARSYLGNNRNRMDYPRYRRHGLPTTSSLVESLVGEVNARVKSTQKHWNRPDGAESILQLRAAVLSQDDRLPRFFTERPGCPFRKRDTCCHKPEDVTAQTVA
ncbi:hypothetical protein GobsT_45020 [Gemmata obscuriglobus]|uniref:hypothetical protein n=1 Tax=Gemmata obscuriglobus TaxID=114 RepID=UPI00049855A3|nr:hypothetical protein [Gemmata obscuriglobus]QEG29704.1 hypothetical protein GobsT_45020 [Gemmata obscuriglobus]VTS09021.1 Uncharacterized protein OS=Rhodopirellula sp. SWK7 GN=RRSWK_01322 PE=4 SV=1 [Gemmata obscuriglobus UQM 2246]